MLAGFLVSSFACFLACLSAGFRAGWFVCCLLTYLLAARLFASIFCCFFWLLACSVYCMFCFDRTREGSLSVRDHEKSGSDSTLKTPMRTSSGHARCTTAIQLKFSNQYKNAPSTLPPARTGPHNTVIALPPTMNSAMGGHCRWRGSRARPFAGNAAPPHGAPDSAAPPPPSWPVAPFCDGK